MINELGLLEIALFFGGGLLAVIQWFLKKWVLSLEKSIEAVQETQHELDKEVKIIKETYSTKADLKDIKVEIVDRLIRIETYLMEKR